jgi:alanine-glyoxylate transaminase / serine-glyoxylate transaminase / serine-pyruvate transaminase
MIYGLHEALRLTLEEGLAARFARHTRLAQALWRGLEALGLTLPVPESERLPPLTLVAVPDGLDDAVMRRTLLERFGVEIGGGLGTFKGRAFRIGLMGASCTERNVLTCLSALASVLRDLGHRVPADPLVAAFSA